MKKNTFIAIIFLAVVGGGLSYFFLFHNKKLSLWSFIPSDALVVYESSNFPEDWDTLPERKIWKNLLNTTGLSKLKNHLELLDSMSAQSNGFTELMASQMMLSSLHSISKSELDFLFIVGINSINQHDYISQLLTKFKSNKAYKFDTRIYLGHQITEVTTSTSSKFSYIFFKNFFVGSFTPFLVEDAIRTVDDSDAKNYYESTEGFKKLSTITKDNGNLYVNASRLDALIGTFGDAVNADTKALGSLIDQSLLDIEVADNHILMTGFSIDNSSKPNYLEIFNASEGSTLDIVDIIPDNTAVLLHYSFDDFSDWHKNLKDYWRKVQPERLAQLGELENRYSLNLSEFYESAGNEVGLVTIESGISSKPDLITCIKSTTPDGIISLLDNISAASTASEYQEVYLDNTIRQIDVQDLPGRLFGAAFAGFESSFYVRHRNFIFLANNERILKTHLDFIASEQTWGKSIKTNKFLDITNREANLSLFINTNKAVGMMKRSMNSKWLGHWEENAQILKQIEYLAFQFTHIDGKYYTNVALQHPGGFVQEDSNGDFNTIRSLQIDSKIITKPFAVRNHNNQALEMLIQGESNDLFLISNDQDTSFQINIGEPINSKIYQLDYYKNNKLQYVFSTPSQIHMLDRTGTYLPEYPLEIPGNSPITDLTLIDYDQSKKYRIMVTTEDGDYYLTDKNARLLDGWKPKTLSTTPSQGGFHLRTQSKDYLIFPSTDGTINVLNRRGHNRPGFPLDLNIRTNNSLFISKGASPARTVLTAISNDGELVSFNLEGKVTNREHIYRASVEDRYYLTPSTNNRKFSILRYNDQEASVLDQNGQEIFKHQYSVSGAMTMQHYVFAPGNEIYAILDRDQEFIYLYDQNGNMLHLQPLQGGNEIAMLYFESERRYKLYVTYADRLQILTIDRR